MLTHTIHDISQTVFKSKIMVYYHLRVSWHGRFQVTMLFKTHMIYVMSDDLGVLLWSDIRNAHVMVTIISIPFVLKFISTHHILPVTASTLEGWGTHSVAHGRFHSLTHSHSLRHSTNKFHSLAHSTTCTTSSTTHRNGLRCTCDAKIAAHLPHNAFWRSVKYIRCKELPGR